MQELIFFAQITLAALLGSVVGFQRERWGKSAGPRTYAMVAAGASLFTILSLHAFTVNTASVASSIVVGIGFLGAGSIILNGSRLIGLTTAGGLWVTAGIGMASGFGLYSLAMITTFFVLFVLIVVNVCEKPIRKISNNIDKG